MRHVWLVKPFFLQTFICVPWSLFIPAPRPPVAHWHTPCDPSPYIFSGHSPTKTQEQSTIPSHRMQQHPKKTRINRIGSNHDSSAQIPKLRRKPDYRVSVLTANQSAHHNRTTAAAKVSSRRARRPPRTWTSTAGDPARPARLQLPTITCQLAIAAAALRAWRPAGSRPRTRAREKASKLTGKSGVRVCAAAKAVGTSGGGLAGPDWLAASPAAGRCLPWVRAQLGRGPGRPRRSPAAFCLLGLLGAGRACPWGCFRPRWWPNPKPRPERPRARVDRRLTTTSTVPGDRIGSTLACPSLAEPSPSPTPDRARQWCIRPLLCSHACRVWSIAEENRLVSLPVVSARHSCLPSSMVFRRPVLVEAEQKTDGGSSERAGRRPVQWTSLRRLLIETEILPLRYRELEVSKCSITGEVAYKGLYIQNDPLFFFSCQWKYNPLFDQE